MNVIETERLVLCHLSDGDADFIIELLNDPSFLKYIGDKGVRTPADARDYINNGPAHSYKKNGFGLYLTKLKQEDVPIGICGLVNRETLPNVDIGFAFMPDFRGKGYGYESAAAVLDHARAVLGLKRVVAVTSPHNQASIRLLEKLGLRFEKMINMDGTDGDTAYYVPAE